MGYVMLYSSVAAVHAIVMAGVRGRLLSSRREYISIQPAGYRDPAPILPIWPMAWDGDVDAILEVVGVSYLLILPMMVWSTTFVRMRKNYMIRVWVRAWVGLVLAGLILALSNEVYVDTNAFPQFRVCSALNGEVPPVGSLTSANIYGRPNVTKTMNETVWELIGGPPSWPLTACFYPCFEASWPLRQRKTVLTISERGVAPSTGNYADTRAGWVLMLSSIVVIAASTFASLMVLLASRGGVGYFLGGGVVRHVSGFRRCFTFLTWWAFYMSPVSFGVFLAWTEYLMWAYPRGEKIVEVGQWSGVLHAIQFLLAALLHHIESGGSLWDLIPGRRGNNLLQQ
ncbi:MAG: hypothetical protein M1839_006443 [Geoglossum umbratile]|nr:MAG: hypothetical protein M1839_006443 [Geoglossum umbratile]